MKLPFWIKIFIGIIAIVIVAMIMITNLQAADKSDDKCWTYWKFEPQKNITAWELSQIIVILNKRFYIMDNDVTKKQNDYVNSFPQSVKRHMKQHKECE